MVMLDKPSLFDSFMQLERQMQRPHSLSHEYLSRNLDPKRLHSQKKNNERFCQAPEPSTTPQNQLTARLFEHPRFGVLPLFERVS